ncbi:MAG: hypothetical protein AAGG06_03155 [Pseudomonadota bacterium]
MRTNTSSTNRFVWVALLFAIAIGFLAAMVVLRGQPATSVPLFLASATAGLIGLAVALRWTDAATMIGTTGAMLVLVEMAMPMLSPAQSDEAVFDPESAYRSGGYFAEGAHGFQPTAGVFDSSKLAPDGSSVYEVTYTIGPDRKRATPAPAGEALPETPVEELHFFGGSFTFGEGLEDDETLPFHVRAARPGSVAVNHGVHGYGLHQAVAIKASLPAAGAPRVNILQTAPWHMQRTACYPEYSIGTPRFVVNGDRSGANTPFALRDGWCGINLPGWAPQSAKKLVDTLLQRSNIVRLARPHVMLSPDEGFDLYVALVRELDRLSRAAGERLIVAFILAEDEIFAGSTWSNDRVLEEFRTAGLEVVDVSLVPPGEVDLDYVVHELDHHPSGLANRIRAEAIVERIGVGPTN